jgi:hypothetical protein
MEYSSPQLPERKPFDRITERKVFGQWSLAETATMHRSLEKMRIHAADHENVELRDGIEMLAANLLTQLYQEVHEDPERAADMVAELTASDNSADKDLACEILLARHYDLLDRGALNDPALEADRWHRLIESAAPGNQRDWFREAPTWLIERITKTGRGNLRPFVEALQQVIDASTDD